MKRMLEKISYGVADSYCDNENIAYTERVMPDGRRTFHFINMSTGSEERQSFTITVKDGGREISHTMDVGMLEVGEWTFDGAKEN